MADRRLVYNQVNAPDLSAASAALGRANAAFNGGLSNATDVLAKYGAGQVERADNDLIGELAALNSEEEFDAFIAGGGLNNRNISEALRKEVANTRSGLLANDNTRASTIGIEAQTEGTRASTLGTIANTDATRARTSIAQAQNARNAAAFNRETALFDEKRRGIEFGRQNAGAALLAQQVARDGLQPGQTGDPVAEYRQSLVDSGQFNLAQINAKMAPILAAEQERIKETNSNDAQYLAELSASANQEVLQNPNVLTDQDLISAVMSDTRFTATENEKRLRSIQGLVSETPGRLAAPVGEDQELKANVSNTISAADAKLRATDQNRAISDIPNFREDPTNALISELGLGSDGQSPGAFGALFTSEPSGFDSNRLKNLVNDYARRLNVEPAVAAVAMREAFNRDPNGVNTLANRFDFEDVADYVQQLDQPSIRNFTENQSNNRLMAIELRNLENESITLRQRLAPNKNVSAVDRALIQARLSDIDAEVAEIEANRQAQ